MDAIERAISYCESGRGAFMADPMRQDAIVRNLEIVGEAAMRDKLAHYYFGVDLALVWDVVAIELPPTRDRLACSTGCEGKPPRPIREPRGPADVRSDPARAAVAHARAARWRSWRLRRLVRGSIQ